MFTTPFGFGAALVGSAPVQPSPSAVAVDRATNTIYVANGNNANGPIPGGDTVSVIDGHRCQASDVSRCAGPWPTITVGNQPSTLVVDEATDTVYVTNNADNTVSVINGATCNAIVTSGCGQTPATVPVGAGPIGIFADDANHTVYVGNFADGTVSMIDSASCNGTHLAGCPSTPPPTVAVGGNPGDVDVNQSTHTVYVANLTGLSVLDANTCNATKVSCTTIGQAPVPPCDLTRFPWCGPFSAKVDAANNTVYESDGTTTLFVFDGRGCNASNLAGCATDTPGAVTPFPEPGFEADIWVSVDAPLHTVYVGYQKDDALVVIDANKCNGRHLSACATLNPPTTHTGADPESVVLDETTQTLYTANEVDNSVSVIDASRCNAQTTNGCRHLPPSVAIPAGPLAADAAAHTVYVASGANAVSMINTQSCNAYQPGGCAHTPPTVTVGDFPQALAVDRRSHTVYVANGGAGSIGTVSVIDANTCNATNQMGCANLATLQVPGGNPDDIAVNSATDTIYVATRTAGGPNLLSVFNGARCNATNTLGCQQTPAVLQVGDSGGGQFDSALNIAVDKATNTIYATNTVTNTVPFMGNSVYVINGATCDAANTSGCGQTPATITISPNPPIGSNPGGIAVDQATNTVYTANIADGEHPGTVSVINGAICNGQNTSGCGQTPTTVAAGFGAAGVTIDRTTNRVYVTNIEDTSVSVIDGATCNASNTTGCPETPPKFAVGDYPGPVAVDPTVGTVYVKDIEGVSVTSLNP
jgi:DNA-binding beta-propeller fold protein YncE